jgi:hypothetical protein
MLRGNRLPKSIGGTHPEIWLVQKVVIFINHEKLQPKNVEMINLLMEWI